MKRKSQVVSAIATIAIGLLGGGGMHLFSDTGSPTGTSSEAINELNCAYRTISPPNGAITDDYEVACSAASGDSRLMEPMDTPTAPTDTSGS